jgi:hypothetical protein
MNEPIIIPMEDDLIHTDEQPFCSDVTCPCQPQIGDRVRIRIPFVDGWQRQGTIYAISHGRYPYQVRVEGASGAYSADELAPASLHLDQHEEIYNGR